MLLYIHGFRSIGLCYKGAAIKAFAPDALTPNLSYSPALAIEYLSKLITDYKQEPLCLIGSSLGGYYATYLACQFNLKAVLINPVIDAYNTLLPAIGRIDIPYSGESFFWSLNLVKELKAFEVCKLKPELFLVLLQTGDKILDYQQAAKRFCDAKVIIQEGGSHRFEDFQSKKQLILDWAASKPY